MSCDMCAAAVRPANMGRPEMHPTAAACPEAYSAAVPAKPAAMSAKACEVSPATVSAAATMPASTATMPAASAAPGVCLQRDKRHDDDQYRGHASASRQREPHGAAGLAPPH